MALLHYFNPENDLALAAGTPHYTPPVAALSLGKAGAYLPMWIAGSDGRYIVSPADNDWIEQCRDTFGITASPFTSADIINGCRPWGWSGHVRQHFLDMGIPVTALPSPAEIDRLRQLSHRRLTIKLHNRLSALLPYQLPPVPMETDKVADIAAMLDNGEHLFLKSPWSGSGRGILDTAAEPVRQLLRQCTGVIKRQGSIMIEKALDKTLDFAMLFKAEGGKVRFVDYSLFFNDSHDSYAGNLLMNTDDMKEILAVHVPREHIGATAEALEQVLTETIGNAYCGYLGIDMMIYNSGSHKSIAPCVEVNLRSTMGVVAHLWRERHLNESSKGIMRITPRDAACHPSGNNMIIENKRLVSGTVSLSPPSSAAFDITVEAEVNKKF